MLFIALGNFEICPTHEIQTAVAFVDSKASLYCRQYTKLLATLTDAHRSVGDWNVESSTGEQ